jgi:ribose transport system permease protein
VSKVASGVKTRVGAAGILNKYGLIIVFAVVVVLFAVGNPDVFPTIANAQSIALTQSTIALIALAATLPMIAGHFDLSVGFQFGMAQGLLAALTMREGVAPALAIVIVLVVGALVGLVNGLLITRLSLPSFTTTIATGILVLGLTQWITEDKVIFGPLPDWFLSVGRGSIAGVPYPFVYVLVIGGVLLFLTERTVWGRSAYAVGDNPEAARLSGIDSQRVVIGSFVIAGVLCALAGSISVTNLGASSPVVGLGTLLPAFAGAFLGATSIRPGRYNVIGTIVAIYLVGTGITGLQQLGAKPYVEQVFNGTALLLAIVLASVTARRTIGRKL